MYRQIRHPGQEQQQQQQSLHWGDGPNSYLQGDTQRIRNTLPLCGRSLCLATVCSTYPIPSHPALFHKDTSLHGAPTVEDALSSLKVRFTMVKPCHRKKKNATKFYPPPFRDVICKKPVLPESHGEKRAIEKRTRSSKILSLMC